jgi:tRNA(Ile2) C34 agmatinyltransferase TiaS
MIFIGLDDTDNLESRGTGHLAREIATNLASDFQVLGVLRHQLLVDPRIRYTSHNSSKSVVLDVNGDVDLAALCERVRLMMLADYQPGSDPGLCVARAVPATVVEFGQRAKREVLTQAQARALAAAHDILLSGVGGDQGGVIGALAAVGLAASGEDGRYVMIGNSRELTGLQPLSAVLATGIAAVRTADGQQVTNGLVQTEKMRPARRGGRPILIVEQSGNEWVPLKLD